jgi:hypothetical protein
LQFSAATFEHAMQQSTVMTKIKSTEILKEHMRLKMARTVATSAEPQLEWARIDHNVLLVYFLLN